MGVDQLLGLPTAQHLWVVTQAGFIAARGTRYLKDVAPQDQLEPYRTASLPAAGAAQAVPTLLTNLWPPGRDRTGHRPVRPIQNGNRAIESSVSPRRVVSLSVAATFTRAKYAKSASENRPIFSS